MRLPRKPRLPKSAWPTVWLALAVLPGGCTSPSTTKQATPVPGAALTSPTPSLDRKEIPLWPGAPPHAAPTRAPENATSTVHDTLVAGRPWTWVTNVSRPTLTVYPARETSRGAAVIVFPGGGYHGLAVDLEGTGRRVGVYAPKIPVNAAVHSFSDCFARALASSP
jgi:hypothetical protein